LASKDGKKRVTTRKRVVTKGKGGARPVAGNFAFTREMIPDMTNGSKQPEFLSKYRAQAWDNFERIEFPKRTDEAWRRTDLRRLQTETFSLAAEAKSASLPAVPDDLLKPLAGDRYGGQILLSPKDIHVTLDPEIAKRGVIFTDLATAAHEHPEVFERVLGQIVHTDEGKFAALAGAFAQSGVLLYIPKGVEVEAPLHSVMWGPGVGLSHFSHILVWIEDQASATYVHEAASPTEEGQTMHSGIVEVYVGKGANLRFVEMQSWGRHVWNFTHERARIDKDAQLDWIFGGVGSHLTKNFTELDLIGEGANGRMSGFVFTDGVQHLDHDTQQNHLATHTTSDLLFKAALAEHSRSVWQGMIYVAPGAQRTDGYQANRNLMISDDARADSIPGLEIMADDVRCTHGSTIGTLGKEEIFYLLTRGIPRIVAEQLIIEGFFDPIMQRIPFEGVRARFQQAIKDKLK
jgi:Fe-S cluster assembly protein SufD